MDILELISKYGIVVYGFAILFGGHWGLKYFSYFKQTKYNFLLFATIVAVIFIVLEYTAGTLRTVDAVRYLLTYTVVTSCYEFLSDKLPFLKPKNEPNDNKQ